jgi:hypothetical protein
MLKQGSVPGFPLSKRRNSVLAILGPLGKREDDEDSVHRKFDSKPVGLYYVPVM